MNQLVATPSCDGYTEGRCFQNILEQQQPCPIRHIARHDKTDAAGFRFRVRFWGEVDALDELSLSSANWIREVIHASVKTSCEPHFLHRLHCVLLVAEGCSCYEVARWLGNDPPTIERWVHALDQHGIEGLRAHHAGGRPTKLDHDHLQRLALDLRSPPRLCGYPVRIRSGKLLSQHIEGRYGVKLTARECQRIIRRLLGPRRLVCLDALAMRQRFRR